MFRRRAALTRDRQAADPTRLDATGAAAPSLQAAGQRTVMVSMLLAAGTVNHIAFRLVGGPAVMP